MVKFIDDADKIIAGVDEAGRGPWAGPVVAACVVIDPCRLEVVKGINDSKKLSKAKREELYEAIVKHHHARFGIASVQEIDELNILKATYLAMKRAFSAHQLSIDHIYVDGNSAPDFGAPCSTVIKGDSKVLQIAAASIIAKVVRDKIMENLHNEFPVYGWINNAGYGTKSHKDALVNFGVTRHHRRTYKPITDIIASEG